ncbi:archease [Candidatus Woesearchaeota archaeon]|nr:archease [Candidatus Woesearchaeota archaeon]
MKYKYLDHTADIMFEAYGNSLNELFENSALATEESMVNLAQIKPKLKKEISLENKNIEYLLFDFLGELIYFKDAELLLFSKIKVDIKKEEKLYKLKALLKGEKLREEHEQKVDVKAITFHKFEIKKLKEKYSARVILDI